MREDLCRPDVSPTQTVSGVSVRKLREPWTCHRLGDRINLRAGVPV